MTVTNLSDLELLTRARDVLTDPAVTLIEGAWASLSGCCVLGAVTLPWEHPLVSRRYGWKQSARHRVANLLLPHLDMDLVRARHHSGELSESDYCNIIDPGMPPLHRVTAYSDYVLYPRMDGKALAIELYDKAIAAELAKRVEYRAGTDE